MKLLFVFLFVTSAALCQTPKYIIGKVLDQETDQGVNNASVINKRSLAVGRTNQIGNYYLQVKPGDSVVVTSPTHGRKAFRWDGTTQQPVLRMKRELADNVINLAEVTVRGKQEAELKRELEQLLSEPEAKRGVTAEQVLDRAASGSVITLLYEAFSRRAKSDRKALVLMQEDRRHKLALYRFELVAGRATDLTGNDLEKFKEFCQLDDMAILQASEYELTFAILQCLKAFKR
ncbi:hypothetical protein [Larkinella arboricola]|uniref:Carboxypeptidase-like protein n=1 Tax=Larkinella arboricola TaxID=643671 RepID=A0A327WTK5_LARAB|nr:hypothetical protein [Larkinella arboricola]RAJ92090.1 hypothetical protein LX87_05054 [Larkinella arboricola]